MDESQPKAIALSLREQPRFAEGEPAAGLHLDRDDLRWFAGAFVAGFLFFLTWLG